MIPAIYERRSIRKFLPTLVPHQEIVDILQSGIKAPSSKNSQPWRYVVVEGIPKGEMIAAFRKGVENRKQENSLPPRIMELLPAVEHTIHCMEQAPVIIFAINPFGTSPFTKLTAEQHLAELTCTQSISASIQNMLLAATEKKLGSLWICDIYFAYPELCQWLATDGELVAAIALGYPGEQPTERPRKPMDEIVTWHN